MAVCHGMLGGSRRRLAPPNDDLAPIKGLFGSRGNEGDWEGFNPQQVKIPLKFSQSPSNPHGFELTEHALTGELYELSRSKIVGFVGRIRSCYPIIISRSREQAEASECSGPAILNMSAESNSSSEIVVGQPTAVRRKQLPRDAEGRFVTTKGYQEVTAAGSEMHSSTPAVGFNWPFITTNDGGENIGEVIHLPLVTTNVGQVAYGSEAPSNTPATSDYNENIDESVYGSKAPISSPTGDVCWPVVATNEEEENIGEVAYNSIVKLESPDPTTLLKIMMGNKYSTDKVSEQFQNVARLQAPDFATILTVMNNAGYVKATDDGRYDVDKVMTSLEGW